MKRTAARLLGFVGAAALPLALVGLQQPRAAEWPDIRKSDTLWPLADLSGPQWPKVPAEALSKPQTVPASPAPVSSSAPKDEAPYAVGSTGDVAAAAAAPSRKSDDELVTGASLDVPPLVPVKAAPPPAIFEPPYLSPFGFEAGARYWYSIGQNRFASFSTVDWDRMQGHSGEAFLRVDHHPTHLYVKGLAGGGILTGGDVDRINPAALLNTTSAVDGNSLVYAMIDFGYAFEVPQAGVRFGAFAGYHYWHERMTAFGILCDAASPNCGPAGSTAVSFGTPAFIFDTTWNAIRIGGDAKIEVFDGWTISGEVAFVPYARVSNEHIFLLRVDPSNILTDGWRGMGAEAEAFIRYRVRPNLELGVGARYWGLFTKVGNVQLSPTFAQDSLSRFSTQRYGVLFEAKATW